MLRDESAEDEETQPCSAHDYPPSRCANLHTRTFTREPSPHEPGHHAAEPAEQHEDADDHDEDRNRIERAVERGLIHRRLLSRSKDRTPGSAVPNRLAEIDVRRLRKRAAGCARRAAQESALDRMAEQQTADRSGDLPP
jgi:hypothetical protein